jgi:hypothetical protein
MAATPIPAPVKATGSHFYRYSEFNDEKREWLQETILEHRIYVPTVPQLNDPADGRPKLARKTEDELFGFLYSSPSGVLGRNPQISIEEQVREGLIVDHNIKHHGTEVIMRRTVESLYRELDDWRIYCLSKRWNNMGMWAKYAGNHTGYCLEFANTGSFFGSAREVSYGQPAELDITIREHMDGRWFFRKTEDWRTEEEVRVLVPRRSSCKTEIDPSWLTRLIIGWKMAESDRRELREWGKRGQPDLSDFCIRVRTAGIVWIITWRC